MGFKNTGITRREFLKATSAGLALGVIGKPGFLLAKEDYDLVVINGDPAAATRKALEAMGGNLPLCEERAAGGTQTQHVL